MEVEGVGVGVEGLGVGVAGLGVGVGFGVFVPGVCSGVGVGSVPGVCVGWGLAVSGFSSGVAEGVSEIGSPVGCSVSVMLSSGVLLGIRLIPCLAQEEKRPVMTASSKMQAAKQAFLGACFSPFFLILSLCNFNLPLCFIKENTSRRLQISFDSCRRGC